jgi:hypothetical protein
MNLLRQLRWTRRGFSLLWGAHQLPLVAAPDRVLSMRQFFAMRDAWPEDLPSGGDAIVVAGLEGCLDALSEDDAVTWMESDLKSIVLECQEFYSTDVALILWLPSGRERICMEPATEAYNWARSPPNADKVLELGRCLWAGAEGDVMRIMEQSSPDDADPDGPAWVGLHHPRIS